MVGGRLRTVGGLSRTGETTGSWALYYNSAMFPSPCEKVQQVDKWAVRHGTTNVSVAGGPDGGGAAPDMSVIPPKAIDHIEMLQDDAAGNSAPARSRAWSTSSSRTGTGGAPFDIA